MPLCHGPQVLIPLVWFDGKHMACCVGSAWELDDARRFFVDLKRLIEDAQSSRPENPATCRATVGVLGLSARRQREFQASA